MNPRVLYVCLVILLLTLKVLCKNGVVLTSTLTFTGRDYACPLETVVVTCSGGIGRELEWTYSGTETLEFTFDANNVNPPDARLNIPAGITVYLTNRTNLVNDTFQYTSQISIERVTINSANVTCTVTPDPINTINVDSCTLSIPISAVPDKPAFKIVDQLGCVGQNENISQYLLEWLPPDNIDNFDLSHYEVNITGPSINRTFRCIETSTIFLLNATTDDVMVNASIVAVNLCGQRGNAMENTSMIQLEKCQSPDSSSIALKISSSLGLLLLIVTLFTP